MNARDLMRVRAQALGYPFLDTADLLAATPDFGTLPLPRAIARGCLPVRHIFPAWSGWLCCLPSPSCCSSSAISAPPSPMQAS